MKRHAPKTERGILSRALDLFQKSRRTSEGSVPVFQSMLQAPGKPVWSPRDYSKFADEAYARNVIAHRAIGLIAQGAASVPWLLYSGKGDNRAELNSHPALTLLNRPNPNTSGSQFIENLIAYRLISGNAYLLAVGPKEQAPLELHLLRPDRVQVVAGKNGLPQGYQYETASKIHYYNVHPVTGRSEILHLKTFHPLNDWYGLSPVEAAAYSIDQHNRHRRLESHSDARHHAYYFTHRFETYTQTLGDFMTSKTHFRSFLVDDAVATIAASGTTSGEIDLSGTTLCGVFIPASFQGTAITFQAATTTGGTFVTVKDGAGNSVSKTVGASQYVKLDPSDFAGIQFLKIVSNATESAERVLTLAARPV